MSPKLPPHSIEAEQSVLGSLMLNNRPWFEIRAILRDEDFYTQDHREIFRAIGKMIEADKPCDFVTLSEAMKASDSLETAGGISYLGTLAADRARAANVKAYALIVRERSILRSLIVVGHDIAGLGYESEGRDPSSLLSIAENRIGSISTGRGDGEIESLQDVITSAMSHAVERRVTRDAGGESGASTGLPTVDDALGAFSSGCLYIIAARPGCGKTAFLNQLAIHSASHGFPGFIASLEMSRYQLGARAAAHLTGTNATELLRGYATTISRTEVGLATRNTAEIPLYIDTLTSDLSAVLSRIHEAKRRYGIKWVAVDHIGLIQGVRANNRNDLLGEITGALKRTAKRLDIAIIGLSQLSRASEKEHRRPQLSDLRDSGNIEQDADLVIFLHDPKQSETVSGMLPSREIGLFKNRDGREGWLTQADFRFDGRSQRFIEQTSTYSECESRAA